MHEDPLLLRVYETTDLTALDAAGHDRSVGTAAGKEWFVTTLEFCDAIAPVLGLSVLKGSAEASARPLGGEAQGSSHPTLLSGGSILRRPRSTQGGI